jgi:hypothetical protein
MDVVAQFLHTVCVRKFSEIVLPASNGMTSAEHWEVREG